MAQRRVRNHRKGNEALGAEPDELLTVKVSRLESEIDNFKEQSKSLKEQSDSLKELYVKIMEIKIDRPGQTTTSRLERGFRR